STSSAAPPHMTESFPFSAPACPPDTGASTKPTPDARNVSARRRASAGLAVVWSTTIAPAASAGAAADRTSSTSGSSPRQENMISAPSTASAGSAAGFPLYADAQADLLPGDRL